jgi:hypothetical protein
MSFQETRPRIWFGPNNNRLTYLQGQMTGNSYYWQRMQATKANWRPWVYALDYIVNPTTGTSGAALTQINNMLAVTPGNILIYEGLQTGDQCRDMALLYDWCWPLISGNSALQLQMKDYILFSVYCCFNFNSRFAQQIFSSYTTDTYFPKGWGVDSPGNNYFTAMMKAPMYMWLTWWPDVPTDLNYPFGSGVSRVTFDVPYKQTPNPIMYTDIQAWFLDRINNIALPAWDSLILGGGWHEGGWYGASPMRNIYEMFATINDVADINYFDSRPFIGDRIMYILFYSLQGGACFEFGEKGPLRSDAAERMSVLYAVNQMRNTLVGSYGQYWLNSNYSLSEASNPAWSYGHDFLLYDDRITANTYANITKHWFARGAGQLYSRKNFGPDDICVMMSSQRQVQDHADHDQNQIQIYRYGHSGATIRDGFLLTDAHAGSENKQWATSRHCSYTLGGGAPYNPLPSADPAGSPPAIGYEIRFAGYGANSTGEITKNFGNDFYSYAQGDCFDGYRAMADQGSSDTAYSYPKINDIFLREMFHLKKIDIVVVYDRVRLIDHYAQSGQPGKAICWWHYPRQQPVGQGGVGVIQVTNGNNRMFRKYIIPDWGASPPSSFSADTNSGILSWNEQLDLPLTLTQNPNRGYGRLLTVFEIGAASGMAAMVSATPIWSTFSNVEGVTIRKPGSWYHIVFSSNQDGLPNASTIYAVQLSGTTDRHIIANLIPGAPYAVSETFISGSTYKYTITTGTTGIINITSTLAGTIEFIRGSVIGGGGGGGSKWMPGEE